MIRKRDAWVSNSGGCGITHQALASLQKMEQFRQRQHGKFDLDTGEIFSKAIVDIHYTKPNNYA